MTQDELDFSVGRSRNPDWETSKAGAKDVEYRSGSQKAKLLAAYKLHGRVGMTDEQAADYADLLNTCYWKRCGEMRRDGKIVPTGETRKGAAGVQRIVCRVV